MNLKCCNNQGCENPPAWLVYWPGKLVSMCEKHKETAVGIAVALGFELTVQPLADVTSIPREATK